MKIRRFVKRIAMNFLSKYVYMSKISQVGVKRQTFPFFESLTLFSQ